MIVMVIIFAGIAFVHFVLTKLLCFLLWSPLFHLVFPIITLLILPTRILADSLTNTGILYSSLLWSAVISFWYYLRLRRKGLRSE